MERERKIKNIYRDIDIIFKILDKKNGIVDWKTLYSQAGYRKISRRKTKLFLHILRHYGLIEFTNKKVYLIKYPDGK